MKRKQLLKCGILVLVLSCQFGFAPKDDKYQQELRPLMQTLFLTMQDIIPLYLNKDQFLDPKKAAATEKLLMNLANQAKSIETKTNQYDDELKAYGSSFEEDARVALQSFQKGAKGQSYYYVEQALDTCFSCHTSRESKSDSTFADLTKKVDWSDIDELNRPRFLSITRQFDKALKEYESLILERGLSMSEVLHYDPFLNYLLLSIRVKDDKDRALKTLLKAQKKSYPMILKNEMKVWKDSLEELIKEKSHKETPEFAEKLIEKGKQRMDYPRDQSGIVYYIEASRILKDQLEKEQKLDQQAKIAYLLGLTELVIGNSFLGLDAQRYFEKTINLQPKTELAKKAFNLYEENLIFGYSGSSGLHLPQIEKEKLDQLRKKAY